MADNPEPGPAYGASARKNHSDKLLRSGQKIMAFNVFLRHTGRDNSKTQSIKLAADEVGISESTMWKIVSEMQTEGTVASPSKKRIRRDTYATLDEAENQAIRATVHAFFHRNEIPTLNKVHQDIRDNDSLPSLSRTSLWRILKKMHFIYEKRGRQHMLIEKPEIILWRRRYLTDIMRFRQQGYKIYYMDETWINAGHTQNRVWKDKTVTSARQAFIEGLSVGLKDPSGKGKRLIIIHIGSDTGFVEGGLLVFESKKSGDCHEDMNSTVFQSWMKQILPLLEPESIIVMDNAPYHSVKVEKAPNSSWKKSDLMEWLISKRIEVSETMLKLEMLDLAKRYVERHPVPYVIDELVEQSGRTVLRTPPYHCKLNPIELVWAQVKGYVSANNTTFKLQDVKTLFNTALELVTPEKWSDCVDHVIQEENKMYAMDNIVENMVEEFKFIVNTGSSSEEEPPNLSDDSAEEL